MKMDLTKPAFGYSKLKQIMEQKKQPKPKLWFIFFCFLASVYLFNFLTIESDILALLLFQTK